MKINPKIDFEETKNRADSVIKSLNDNPKPEGTLGKIAARKHLQARGLSRDEAEEALARIPAIERDVDGIKMKSWKIEDLT